MNSSAFNRIEKMLGKETKEIIKNLTLASIKEDVKDKKGTPT